MPRPAPSHRRMSRVSDERARWLARHVLPHEPALRAWLSTRRVADLEVDDIVQETYARLASAESVATVRNARTYAFQRLPRCSLNRGVQFSSQAECRGLDSRRLLHPLLSQRKRTPRGRRRAQVSGRTALQRAASI